MRTLVGLLVLACPPLAAALSIAGIIRDERKRYAVVMLAVSGVITLYFLWASGILRRLFC